MSTEIRFRYASPDTWEDWQRAYRFGALYIFPPSPLIETVDALRRRYDPASAAICSAHISITEPLAAPLIPEQERQLAEVCGAFLPLRLRYGPVETLSPSPVVVLAIEPSETITDLRNALQATSAFRGGVSARYPFLPHMTIAEFISPQESQQIQRELRQAPLQGEFTCHAVEYAIPTDAFVFERVAALPHVYTQPEG